MDAPPSAERGTVDTTARTTANQQLVTALTALLEQSPDALLLLDAAGTALYASPAARRLFGDDARDMLGASYLDVIHPKDYPFASQLLRDVAAEPGASRSALYQVRARDGGWRAIEATWSNRLDDPAIAAIVVNARDVTEDERSVSAVRASQERLELAQRAGGIGTFEWDIANGQIYWTPELEALYGVPAGGFEGTLDGFMRYVHPDDHDVAASLIGAALAGQGPYDAEFRIVWPDGTVRWMRARGDVFFDGARRPVRMVGLNIDITDRKVLDNNLRYLAQASKLLSSSLDFATIWRNLTELAVPYIADWCAVDILNERQVFDIAAIAHRDPEKVELVKTFRLAHPIDINDAFGLPVVIKTKQPEYIPDITDELLVAISPTPEQLETIRTLGMTSALSVPLIVRNRGIGAITFVTSDSRRRLTGADVAMAQELASRASLALENATLYAEAQEAIATRDNFISVASHELKTPITSLKMYTQVVRNQLLRAGDERAAGSLEKIDTQTNKLTRLVNDLLDVSRMRRGQLEYRDEDFDLGEVVREAVEHVALTSEGREVRVEGAVEGLVHGDRDRIGQVIINLLTNALKFSPRTMPVDVRFGCAGGQVTVSVRDYGIGVDTEHQARLFERFYRVDDPNERTYPGLGIGLYVAEEIVRRHGGVMRVVSEKGHGAEFSFTLPHDGGGRQSDQTSGGE